MEMYEFSIIASGLEPSADDFETRFYDAGCDDATIAFQRGHIIVDFTRQATSLGDAINSAIEDVRSTGARVDRVEPDPLVSISDIAARASLSRQIVSLYAKGARGEGFPAPVARVTSDSPLWNWASVAKWLQAKGSLATHIVDQAISISKINESLDQVSVTR